MITFRTYNAKLNEVESWKTTDKTPCVEIHDSENKLAYSITFGPTPKVAVFEYEPESGNFGEELYGEFGEK